MTADGAARRNDAPSRQPWSASRPKPTRGGRVFSPRRLVIGVGNPDRGDDGVGVLVARLLRYAVPGDVSVEAQHGAAAELIDRLQDADSLFLVDAVVTGAPAGTIQMFDCTVEGTLPCQHSASSHGLGVAEALALARALHGLPRICRLYAVEGTTFVPGAAMSPPVRAAAERLAAQLAQELWSH